MNHSSKSYLLSGIGLLILFIACVNFTNMSLARSSIRTTEIGIRKLLGAEKKNLIDQFMCESIMIISVSMILALVSGYLLFPLFNQLANKDILRNEILAVPNLALYLCVSIFLGLLTGLYPGLILSRIQTVKLVRGFHNFGRKSLLTRVLIVAQLSTSVFLVIAASTLSKQMNFILNKELGYDREEILIVDTLETRDYEVNKRIFDFFETEVEKLPFVKSISGCIFPLSAEIGDGKLTYNGKRLSYNYASVHYNFFDTMGIKFVAGEDFPRPFPEDIEPVIVTESFVNAYGINNPLGIRINPGTEIIGIVEDFHFWNLKEKIKPTIIRFDRRIGPRNLLVQIDTDDTNRATAALKNIWGKIQPNKPFVYAFEDDIFLSKYAEQKRQSLIVFYSSLVAIMISCMGLVSIAMFAMSRRVKEIGIRRILGAPIQRICILLIGDFVILAGVSNLIAWPGGYYVMRAWLYSFAYRINLDVSIFLMTGFLTLLIFMAIIGLQIIRVVSVKPVEYLRYE